MLLAIDTSTDWAGLALYDGSVVLAETTWRTARQHTEQIVAQLDLVCKHLAITPADLQCIAVATGPGSWAGLRVGLSFAKALAVARNLPIVGVATTDSLAWPHRHAEGAVVALIRLGRDRYAMAQFAPLTQPCAPSTEPQAFALPDLPVLCALYVGDIDVAVREHIGSLGTFPSPADNVRRPAALAELAWNRYAAGDTDDIVALEPIYLGSPVRQLQG